MLRPFRDFQCRCPGLHPLIWWLLLQVGPLQWVVLFVEVLVAVVGSVLLVQIGVGLVVVKGMVVILRVQKGFPLPVGALVRVQSGLLALVVLVLPVLVLVRPLLLVVSVLTILTFLGEAPLVQ